MTLAEQGAYRNLLDELWVRGGVLPNDERILAKISGDALAWPSVRVVVMRHFYQADGGLRNSTHDEVSAESRRRAEKQRRYRDGLKSGNAGGNAGGNNGSHVTPSPGPGPGPSKGQGKGDTDQAAAPLALVPPPDARTKPRRRAAKDTSDRSETRALCDAQGRVTGKDPTYSATMLEAFGRLLDAGRSAADVERVLVAYRDRATSSAAFARDGQGGRGGGGPGLHWALRPGDSGGFDKILMQLEDGAQSAQRPGGVFDGSAARLRARMGSGGNGEH